MQRDVRNTPESRAVEALYRDLYAPGTGHVYGTTEAVPAADGRSAYLTGLRFPGNLVQGPARSLYKIDFTAATLISISTDGARLPRPSPRGDKLAYVLPGTSSVTERLIITDGEGGNPTDACAVEGTIEQIDWSPDGRTLLLLLAGAGADLAGYQGGYALPTEKEGPEWLPEVQTGEEGFLWRRLSVLDVETGKLTSLSKAGTNVWEASWCGTRHIAAICSCDHSEGAWYEATLRLISKADGTERELYRPIDQIGLPVGAPDGRHIAFVEAVCSDRGIVCGRPMLATAEGVVRELDTRAVEVTSLAWRDEKSLHFAGHRAFETVIGDYEIAASISTELWRSETVTCGEWYPAAKPLPAGNSLIVAEAYDQAPQLAIVSRDGLSIVHSFAAPEAQAAMAGCGHIAPVTWQAPDGLEIHGWLVRPEQQSGSAPLVLDIHGGPVWANRNRWMGRLRATPLLARQGCMVLYANPRGSSTRGQDFARLVKGDMGGADTSDFLAALNHFIKTGDADPSRLACTGTSYGGFMSSWLVTQDTRFAAAAPISPVTDWYSQHRTSQIPYFDEIFLEKSASSADGLHFNSSPVMFADRVRTPCLIMAGALDKNTPPTQAQEFHQSLREQGVRSVLVVYPGDGHSLRGFPAYFDTAARILLWFGEYLRLPPIAADRG